MQRSYHPVEDEALTAYLQFWQKPFSSLIDEYLQQKSVAAHTRLLTRIYFSQADKKFLLTWAHAQNFESPNVKLTAEELVLIGHAYLYCTRNSKQAFEYYYRAQDEGGVPAKYSLGMFYLWHKKTEDARRLFLSIKDVEPAAAYELSKLDKRNKHAHLRQAEEGDDLFALNEVAINKSHYLFFPNKSACKEADEIFKRGVKLGDPLALFNLGLEYEIGRRLTKDRSRAAIYYRLAGMYGCNRANKSLKEMLTGLIRSSRNPVIIFHGTIALAGDKDISPREFKLLAIEQAHLFDRLLRQDKALGLDSADAIKQLLGDADYELVMQRQELFTQEGALANELDAINIAMLASDEEVIADVSGRAALKLNGK